MLVTHSVCAAACWYGSSPGAVPATGTTTGWAGHPTQRKTQRTKGMTPTYVPEHTLTGMNIVKYGQHTKTHTHTQAGMRMCTDTWSDTPSIHINPC